MGQKETYILPPLGQKRSRVTEKISTGNRSLGWFDKVKPVSNALQETHYFSCNV